VNGATLAEDRNGETAKAYSFDGNDYIIGDKSLKGLQNFTESIWFKLDNDAEGAFREEILPGEDSRISRFTLLGFGI